MRHETIATGEGRSEEVNLASLWPVGVTAAPFPISDAGAASEARAVAPIPSASDLPGGVGSIIAFVYAALIAFALASAGSADSAFKIVLAFLFVVTFFTIPRLFLHASRNPGRA